MNLSNKLRYAIITAALLILTSTCPAETTVDGGLNGGYGGGFSGGGFNGGGPSSGCGSNQNPVINFLGLNNPQSQPPQSTFPQAYEESTFPPRVNMALDVKGTVIRAPGKDVLRALYGDDFKKSNYWQTRKQLYKDNKFTNYISSLQKTRNKDVDVIVHYDDPKRLLPGETFNHFDKESNSWKRYTVNKGDTAAVVAQNLGLTEDKFIKDNNKRFNIHNHARWKDASVHLTESRPMGGKYLRGLLAHEITHTVDGTCGVGDYELGPDGKHYIDEYTNKATAWQEGLANYTGGLFDSRRKDLALETVDKIRMETRDSTPDNTIMEDLFNPSYTTRVGTEGVVSNVLTAIDGRGANRQNILDTVKAGNQDWQNGSLADRNIETFTTSYIARNPDQVSRSLMALDLATGFTADDDKLRQLAGNVDASDYLDNRDKLQQLEIEHRWKNPDANIFDFYNKLDRRNFTNKLDKIASKNGIEPPKYTPPAEGTPMVPIKIFGIETKVPQGMFDKLTN